MRDHGSPGRARRLALGMAGVLWMAAMPAVQAKIDLVTLPERDRIQISIYNSEDLTLVRESRRQTFRQGRNQIQFSWANTLIDPTSLQLLFPERSENFDILDITYPANTQNVLIWNVEAKQAGPAAIEITYFTSGLSWEADYVARANPEETAMSLEGYVRVNNQSGEDFENTQTRLVVGTINLVEKIADLARRGIIPEDKKDEVRREAGRMIMAQKMAAPAPAAMAVSEAVFYDMAVKEIVKQAVSEYQLYTIEGTENLPTGWSKRLRSFAEDTVKIQVAYEYDDNKYGPQVVKFYKLKNDTEHKLGKDPLPDGAYRVFRETGEDGLVWGGQHTEKYVPIGEKLELNLGSDGMIIIEPKLMNFKRTDIDFDEHKDVRGWVHVERWTLEIRNSKPVAVPIKITRTFSGDWSIEPTPDAATTFKKKDKSRVEFETTVEGLGTRVINYVLTTRHGTRSNQQ